MHWAGVQICVFDAFDWGYGVEALTMDENANYASSFYHESY